ncbi:hypothetical protein [Streptomyces sp. NPDC058623]|uniref:hypothetical protein n=1 Tax=Streptomyces sp. NPDC058623 TaxID=3346563 RepID=UPI00365286F0
MPTGLRCGRGPEQWTAGGGNVPGRIARATRDGLDAVVLAAAGPNRLGLTPEVHEALDPAVFPPPPGQGALGVQVRADSRGRRVAGGDRGAGRGDVKTSSRPHSRDRAVKPPPSARESSRKAPPAFPPGTSLRDTGGDAGRPGQRSARSCRRGRSPRPGRADRASPGPARDGATSASSGRPSHAATSPGTSSWVSTGFGRCRSATAPCR